jgi:hypothetical protein
MQASTPRRRHSRTGAWVGAVLALAASAAPLPAQQIKTPPKAPPLPQSQQAFRIDSLLAVGPDLYAAALAADDAYASDLREGWRRETISRNETFGANKAWFGENGTIFIFKKDDERKIIEIAVRGTVNLDDLLRDMDSVAVADDIIGAPLHRGFRSLARGVLDRIKTLFTADEINSYEFRLYGHSLGGAIVSIVAMYLHQAGSHVSLVVTFGGPRFTTNEGAHKYQTLNQRTFRVVRCDDAIAFLPPPNFIGWSTGSYQGSGNILLLLRPPYFDYSQGVDIERDFVNQLRLELGNRLANGLLAFGHRMDNYKSLLGWFISRDTPVGAPRPASELKPVSYQLARQQELCPKDLVRPLPR